ncbi:glycine zipper domain-containing protein [Burkholderia thailandensis]|nr:glycine zipper domain-containing protein [Burkholderia thailandensis]AHI74726.1 glycine zipper family protein [Burkholderia thailandensis 2002721723]AHI79754.1 glycine zipper family protein [Burkholderia thailandensis E444]AIC88245.1 glycine zipper family protein [Burkholderia thailandensis USAMRU Malaysia \
MSLIVAARFTTQRAAEAAAQRLLDSGFVAEDVSLFFVNPRGQHAPRWSEHPFRAAHPAAHPIAAMQHARHGTTIGAVAGAICGVALFSLVTPSLVVAIWAAGVGAFLGGWVGGMMHKEDFAHMHVREFAHDAIHHETRASGMLVAVHVTADSQADAARVLADAGGADIERATGRWQSGRWADFDPTRAPEPFDGARQPAHRHA